jgi:hypothetical protein
VRPGPRVLSPKQQKSSPTTHAQTRDEDGTAARRRISHRVAPRLAWAGLVVLLPRFCCRCAAGGAQRARRQHKQEAPKLYPRSPDMDIAAVSRSAVQRNATHRASSGDLKRRSTPLALPIHYGARPNGSRRAHAPTSHHNASPLRITAIERCRCSLPILRSSICLYVHRNYISAGEHQLPASV